MNCSWKTVTTDKLPDGLIAHLVDLFPFSILTTAEDSVLEKNDPRRWLTADKATLRRRLSVIEAKNDVRSLANKFRKENGRDVNPRKDVVLLAQRARMERSDEESRLIVKEFLAQSSKNKTLKRNTISNDSSLVRCDERRHDNCTKEFTPTFMENSAIDQLRKSQRKFFGRPRSRTQVSPPADWLLVRIVYGLCILARPSIGNHDLRFFFIYSVICQISKPKRMLGREGGGGSKRGALRWSGFQYV